MNPALIALALQGLLAAIDVFHALRKEGLRTGVLTPEQDAELDRQAEERFKSPHWQIDP